MDVVHKDSQDLDCVDNEARFPRSTRGCDNQTRLWANLLIKIKKGT